MGFRNDGSKEVRGRRMLSIREFSNHVQNVPYFGLKKTKCSTVRMFQPDLCDIEAKVAVLHLESRHSNGNPQFGDLRRIVRAWHIERRTNRKSGSRHHNPVSSK